MELRGSVCVCARVCLIQQEWTGELRNVERAIFVRQRLLAFISGLSILLGCMVNEICAGGDYLETKPDAQYQAWLEDPQRPPRACSSTFALTIKMAQSGLTILMFYIIVARFRSALAACTLMLPLAYCTYHALILFISMCTVLAPKQVH